MTLETPRLLLRRMDETDLELIRRLYSDEEILRYSPFDVMDREAAARHLQGILRAWEMPDPANREFAVIARGDGAAVGRCHAEVNPETDTAMVGCHLLRDAWGQGYAAELLPALIDYSFDVLQVHRVNALCNPENVRSRRMLERCGMRLEAHFVKKCRYLKRGAVSWQDELEYAILREEWQKK